MNSQQDQIGISDDGGTTLWTRPNRSPSKFSDLESRLDRIAAHVEILNSCPTRETTPKSPHACDPAQELGVKAEAARWMLRVTKHLSELAREKVLVAVARSIEELERIVDAEDRHIAPPIAAHAAHASSHR
jgi:hypothetical protein